jgi:hypothetical protein
MGTFICMVSVAVLGAIEANIVFVVSKTIQRFFE